MTVSSKNKTETRGGKRPGAGRKALEKKKSYTFYLSERMAQKVREFIENLRKEPLDDKKNK